MVRLKRRAEFLAVAATGQRWIAPAFVLQVGPRRSASAASEIGLGFTASRRIGNAVARNRAKRRLAAATRLLLPDGTAPARDYVLVARSDVLTCPFPTLLEDLAKAFSRVHASRPRPSMPPARQPRPNKPRERSQSGS